MSSPSFKPVKKFVRAGAGAGKTWNLTRQVVGLAMQHHEKTEQWPKTVLTTFTRKATQELKERLLVYCIEEKPEAIEFVQSSSFLNITTMHGLFNVFLSRYGSALGLPTQFEIVDASRAEAWRKKILKDLIVENSEWRSLQVFDFKRLLNYLQQFEQVYWLDSAKPISSIEEMERLHQEFCRETSAALKDFITRANEEADHEKWLAYFEILNGLVEVLDSNQNWNEKRQSLEAYKSSLSKPRRSKNNPGLSEELDLVLSDQMKAIKKWFFQPEYDAELWPQWLQCQKEFLQLAEKFYQQLYDKKISEAALETNDLEYFTLKLLHQQPEVVEQFANDVDAWFIDEFQDTSPLQLQILDRMIGKRSCYMVGDPQQSIYLFRGSRSEVFFQKQQEMVAAGHTIEFLQDNYRSQKTLLEFFNLFFVELGDGFSAMQPKVEAIEGQASVSLSVFAKDNTQGELAQLSHQLNELIKQGVSPKEICILARTRRQLDRLQKQLIQLGFPVISHSTGNFYERREILDAMALLRFLINPWDNKNLVLLLRSPWLSLTDSQLIEIIDRKEKSYWPLFKKYIEKHPDYAVGQSLLQALQDKNQLGVAWVFRRLILDLGVLHYSRVVDSTGRREANLWKLINQVEKLAREPGGGMTAFTLEGLQSSSLEDIGDSGDASSPVEPNKINLMTIHASKGLQFEYVFLPFLHKKPKDKTHADFTEEENRRLWSFRYPALEQSQFVGNLLEMYHIRDHKKREADEALRVLYVAMTRAKLGLYMSWTGEPEKSSWGQKVAALYAQWQDHPWFSFYDNPELDPETSDWSETQVEVRPPYKPIPDINYIQRENKDEQEVTSWRDLEKAQEKKRLGTVLHRVFENIKLHGVEATVALANLWLPTMHKEISEALDFVLRNTEVPFSDIIHQGHVEWGYQKEDADGLKERRIDLWGVVDETLWVVDYKTGSSRYKDKAFAQMSEYAETLKPYLNWSGDIRLVAVYPFSQELFLQSLD